MPRRRRWRRPGRRCRRLRPAPVYAQQDATRLEQIYAEDPGAISVRRVQSAQATRLTAAEPGEDGRGGPAPRPGDRGRERRQERAADQCPLGGREGRAGPQAHRSGRSRRRLGDRPAHRRRAVCAGRRAGDDPDRHSRPLDQRRHDREQPRQHQARRRGGDRARRDAGRGVEGPRAQRRHAASVPAASRSPARLPQVENSRDWLRQAQRFPVAVEFDPSERERLRGVRIGARPTCWSTRATMA